nr:Eco57I restriction-modification methylase domain-containing protein [Bacteroidales bacterium]
FNYDILTQSSAMKTKFDIVVSNPPYIRNKEKLAINKNVLENEPELALFVSDNDPLIFYRKILTFAQNYLAEKGKIFFEINEELGIEMKDIMKKMNFYDIILKKDINNKDRMICGTIK